LKTNNAIGRQNQLSAAYLELWLGLTLTTWTCFEVTIFGNN